MTVRVFTRRSTQRYTPLKTCTVHKQSHRMRKLKIRRTRQNTRKYRHRRGIDIRSQKPRSRRHSVGGSPSGWKNSTNCMTPNCTNRLKGIGVSHHCRLCGNHICDMSCTYRITAYELEGYLHQIQNILAGTQYQPSDVDKLINTCFDTNNVFSCLTLDPNMERKSSRVRTQKEMSIQQHLSRLKKQSKIIICKHHVSTFTEKLKILETRKDAINCYTCKRDPRIFIQKLKNISDNRDTVKCYRCSNEMCTQHAKSIPTPTININDEIDQFTSDHIDKVYDFVSQMKTTDFQNARNCDIGRMFTNYIYTKSPTTTQTVSTDKLCDVCHTIFLVILDQLLPTVAQEIFDYWLCNYSSQESSTFRIQVEGKKSERFLKKIKNIWRTKHIAPDTHKSPSNVAQYEHIQIRQCNVYTGTLHIVGGENVMRMNELHRSSSNTNDVLRACVLIENVQLKLKIALARQLDIDVYNIRLSLPTFGDTNSVNVDFIVSQVNVESENMSSTNGNEITLDTGC